MSKIKAIKPLKPAAVTPTENRYQERSGLHWMAKEDDPKGLIGEAIGDALENITMIKALVLVATYKRPLLTAGGISLDGRNNKEDKFQGRVGLVMAMGPLAFQNDDKIKWGDRIPQLGDWVFYDADEGRATSIMGVHCRVFEDVCIDGILKDPNIVF